MTGDRTAGKEILAALIISKLVSGGLTKSLFAAAALLAAAGCKGDVSPPQYVKGPLSGYVYDCEQAGQSAPKAASYLSSHDLDGDGLPDFIIDASKGCASNKDLYCSQEGCLISIYVSSKSGNYGSFRVKGFEFVKVAGKPAIELAIGGPACASAPQGLCRETRTFTGEEFALVPAAK